ncbi:MAG: SPASM domain-containing protein [Bacteroidales bacterium]|jgi:uncharacterized protein|nr:SPASM domain-containing protein [Bacteroidales bacterium]
MEKNKKLRLNKMTVAELNSNEQGAVYSGAPLTVTCNNNTTACNTGYDCTLDMENQLKFKLDVFYKHWINLGYYPAVRDNICMAQHINSFVIDANGNITKCWLDVGREDRTVANINTSKFVNHSLFTKYLVACNPFHDTTCMECKVFPVCGGGCQHDRIENKYFSAHHNLCTIYKDGLGKLLYTHYLTKQQTKTE